MRSTHKFDRAPRAAGLRPGLQQGDLSRELVKTIVRTGVKSMPFTRKTEISDADLDDLANYLGRQR
jgi:mono/diheme cytochrome c family protein